MCCPLPAAHAGPLIRLCTARARVTAADTVCARASALHSNLNAAAHSCYTIARLCNAAGTVTSGCHTADTARQSGAATQELENGAWQLGIMPWCCAFNAPRNVLQGTDGKFLCSRRDALNSSGASVYAWHSHRKKQRLTGAAVMPCMHRLFIDKLHFSNSNKCELSHRFQHAACHIVFA
jgi:hypothetical protein